MFNHLPFDACHSRVKHLVFGSHPRNSTIFLLITFSVQKWTFSSIVATLVWTAKLLVLCHKLIQDNKQDGKMTDRVYLVGSLCGADRVSHPALPPALEASLCKPSPHHGRCRRWRRCCDVALPSSSSCCHRGRPGIGGRCRLAATSESGRWRMRAESEQRGNCLK